MPEALTLGFDTSAAHCAAALLSGETLLTTRQEEMAKGQAERLMPLIEELLAEAGIGWRDLALIGGLLFSAGFGDTSSKEPEIDEVQEGDDGIVKISRSTSSYNDPNQAQSRPRPISARQVRKDLDLARVG